MPGGVPAGLIEQHDRMGAGRDQDADLLEVGLHRRRVAAGHDQTGRLGFFGTDGAEDIGGLGALIVRRTRPRAASGPAPGQPVLLADTGLVLEPDLDFGAGAEALFDPAQLSGEVFLNATIAAGSWA
jgi:hypothetical protein